MSQSFPETSSSLRDILLTLQREIISLTTILHGEQEALKVRNRQALLTHLRKKNETLSKIDSELEKLAIFSNEEGMVSNGDKKSRFSQILTQKETHVSNLQNLWQDLQVQAENARRLNTENNRIVELSRSLFAVYLQNIKELQGKRLGYDKNYAGKQLVSGNMIINRTS
ncbi:MAG: flagellar export chaperone FlgN [Deferribacteres bacterium]|nr:flagellar export chaperone FlgN [candidate division KSB1 bacterium]MCB9501962.1 flagellar export chaperone FlgN [Deferribacteres bacterium]